MTDQISALVLQEFRLRAPDTEGKAARIVAGFDHGIEPTVPLLTSIDDCRDVATVRGVHPGETSAEDSGTRAALGPLVETWQPLKRYRARITERSEHQPTQYRLAVTESGIHNGTASPAPAPPQPVADAARLPRVATDEATSIRLSLLWTGVSAGTSAGLMLLQGSDEGGHAVRRDPAQWPLPLSRALGVRIYESQPER